MVATVLMASPGEEFMHSPQIQRGLKQGRHEQILDRICVMSVHVEVSRKTFSRQLRANF